jgi:hypothetical protein
MSQPRTSPAMPPPTPAKAEALRAGAKDPVAIARAERTTLQASYALARKGDYEGAREQLLAVTKMPKGVETFHPDWGSNRDQAFYQAAVCLYAQGKKDEAAKEFRAFIRDNWQSPLLMKAFRRLAMINGGEATPADEALYQASFDRQQKQAQIMAASCGPRTVAYLGKTFSRELPPYDDLVKLCGTDERGSTLANLSRALTTLGMQNQGMEVNRTDFNRLKPPFVWLRDSHYVVVTARSASDVTVWNPLFNREQTLDSSSLKPDFRTHILKLEPRS